MKSKVLILAPFYIPSVKGGGPIQSIKNIVENLHERIDFYILTSDRDLGDLKHFENIKTGEWINMENAKIMYINKDDISVVTLRKIMKSELFDYYYLNSFFDYRFSILPMLTRKLSNKIRGEIIITPRGEFTEGALGLKKIKKRTFIKLSKMFNLYNNINWHATNKSEKNEIKRIFKKADIKVANNLTANYKYLKYTKQLEKIAGEINIAYISRIHPTKNLLTILNILITLNGRIFFNIYGPIEDKDYWLKCTQIIKKMPNNVTVNYYGLIKNNEIPRVYKKTHIFILLTLGENFGHVISEALIGGCPVIISNTTPWKNLEKEKVGWDIPLKDIELVTEKIKYFVNMGNDEYNTMSKNAFIYSQSQSNKKSDINNYIKLFNIN